MAFTKINESDYSNKGIRTKSNPLNMSVTDAQRAFDELPLDVIIPKVNALSEEIDEYAESTDIKIENLKTRATNSEEALGNKVEKEEGKGLSANDYSNEEKQKVAEAYTDKHTHENKEVLDGVTAEKVAEWNSKVDAEYVNDTVNEKVTELGAADMMKATYDPQGKQTDVFKYVDDAVGDIDAEDVGAQKADFGILTCANLLEWASVQSVGGFFVVSPEVTTEGVPTVTWYSGELNFSRNGNAGEIQLTQTVTGNRYYNRTVGGVWQAWTELFTTAGGTLSGSLTLGNSNSTSNTVLIQWDNCTFLRNVNKNDNTYNEISISNANELCYYSSKTGKLSPVFGEHNTDLLAARIQSLINSGVINVGAVKSVQSGRVASANLSTSTSVTDFAVGTGTNEKNTYYIDITISAVSNINKCQVDIETFIEGSAYRYVGWLVNNTTLRVGVRTAGPSTSVYLPRPFRWEVTEFC